ncbi:hypothetical protein [Murinocardiopsis flavida]|uniref:hypothetical protein n=1 Tax=Murinocardiopsis flavida TaxID=645275 RepID=UPI001473D7A9|nr:hypothetical protein [Murinocardiopsis flavida]
MTGVRAALPVWARAGHDEAGLPSSVAYLPQADLAPWTPDQLGFGTVARLLAGQRLPMAQGIGADLTVRDRLRLITFTPASGQDPDADTVHAESVLDVATGVFDRPAPAEWNEKAFAMGFLVVATGPRAVARGTSALRGFARAHLAAVAVVASSR